MFRGSRLLDVSGRLGCSSHPFIYDQAACLAPRCNRTPHNIVGLAPGPLGVPHRWLPPACNLMPAGVRGGVMPADSAPAAEDAAIFVTSDGGVGVVQLVRGTLVPCAIRSRITAQSSTPCGS